MSHATDETLSALLDGETVEPGDAAHLDDCEDCRERLQAFQRAAASLAEPVDLPKTHVRETALRNALVQAEGSRRAWAATARRAASAQAPRPRRRVSSLSAAAALIVALGVGSWAISQIGSGPARPVTANTLSAAAAAGHRQTASGNPTKNAPLQAAPASKFGAAAAGASGAAASPALRAGTFINAGAIGQYEQLADVADRARADLDQFEQDASTPPTETQSPCPVAPDQYVEWHATLTYRGEQAYARVVGRSTSSARTLEVLDQANCALVESQAI